MRKNIQPSSYKQDFYAWTRSQLNYLKNKQFDKLDIEKLEEEIKDLGDSKESAIESYLSNLLMHLLKIKYQPERHGKSWDLTIKNAKFQISRILKKNPSLKKYPHQALTDCYYTARLKAAIETDIDLKVFPKVCPWKIEEIL